MARMLEHAKPDQIVELVLPFLWAALTDGRAPANICVDACMTLRNAYGQLGVRAELLPVTVAIQKKDGAGTLYGSLTPSWTGTEWSGHCVLALPDSERFVDPTIEQFTEIRKIGMGPSAMCTASSAAPADRPPRRDQAPVRDAHQGLAHGGHALIPAVSEHRTR